MFWRSPFGATSEGRIQALQNAAPSFVTVIEDAGGDDFIGVMGLSADPSNYNPVGRGHSGTLYMPAGLNPSNDHHVGIVEFDLSDNYSHLRNVVLSSGNLTAGRYTGTTGTGGALRDAAHYLANSDHARSDARRIIVLMSDGYANRPSSDGPGYARSMATYAANLSVTVYTISLGSAADLTLMQDIADTANGQHFDATGAGEAELTEVLIDAFEQAAQAIKRPQLVQ